MGRVPEVRLKSLLYILAAAMLLTVAVPTQSSIAPPFGAVRVVSKGDTKFCSAVVVSPGVAITAAHCLQNGMAVDGLGAQSVERWLTNKDIAVLHVYGLKCPCAKLGARPAKGDQVLAVGFPADREGEQAISAVARVASVGALRDALPAIFDQTDPTLDSIYIVTDTNIINPGDSGGALFSMQDGEWRVIGINAIRISDPSSCNPFIGCSRYLSSGFVPVDLVNPFLTGKV
jgi:hypothetical protein